MTQYFSMVAAVYLFFTAAISIKLVIDYLLTEPKRRLDPFESMIAIAIVSVFWIFNIHISFYNDGERDEDYDGDDDDYE